MTHGAHKNRKVVSVIEKYSILAALTLESASTIESNFIFLPVIPWSRIVNGTARMKIFSMMSTAFLAHHQLIIPMFCHT